MVMVVPLWKRYELTAKFLDYYSKVKEWLWLEHQIKFNMVCVCSEEQSVQQAVDAGMFHCMAENQPLSMKVQAGCDFAATLTPDYVILNGSDDFISRNYFTQITNYCSLDEAMGLRDIFLYDFKNQKLGYFHYDKDSFVKEKFPKVVGPCRVFGKNFLTAMNWEFCTDAKDRSLEMEYDRVLISKGLIIKAINPSQLGVILVDVKTEENMWKWSVFEGRFFSMMKDPGDIQGIFERGQLGFLSSVLPRV